MNKRPELVPENHLEIYKYFRNFEPNERIQRLGFAIMHAAFKSEVHYVGESGTIVGQHLLDGGNVIMLPNHQANEDTPTLAGLVYEKPFELLRGTTRIPTKHTMFDWPLLGRFFPHMFAYATFRGKDFPKTPEGKELRGEVNKSWDEFSIECLDRGENLAPFGEGRRNTEEPGIVQPIRGGLGRIAIGVKDPDNLLLVPLGFAYRHHYFKNHLNLSPIVVVEEPFCPGGMTAEQVTEEAHKRIQLATTQAFTLAA